MSDPLRKNWQCLESSRIREYQATKLRRYLQDIVVPFSPYYQNLFHDHGLDPKQIRDLDDLQLIPYTSKSDLLPDEEHPERTREFVIQPDSRTLACRPSTIGRALIQGRTRTQQQLEQEFRPIFMTCTTGRSRSFMLPAMPGGDVYFVVVPSTGDGEGSYGTLPPAESPCKSPNAADCPAPR